MITLAKSLQSCLQWSPLHISKMHTKATAIYPCLYIGLAKMSKFNNINYCPGTLIYCWWECILEDYCYKYFL